MIGIGQRLRSAREARGLSLDEIEAATRIRRRYLEALEAEAFDQLPAPAYAKAFLRSYASYLGLPAEDVLGMHPELRSGPLAAEGSPVDVRLTPATPQSRARRIITAIAAFVAIGVLFLAYTLYGQLRQFASTPPPGSLPGQSPSASAPGQPSSSGGETPVATQTSPGAPQGAQPAGSPQAPGSPGTPVTPTTTPAPSPSSGASPASGTTPAPSGSPIAAQEGGNTGAHPSSPTPTATPPPKPPNPEAVPSPSAAPPAASTAVHETLPAGPLQVSVEATDRSWIRTVADGVTVFEGYVNSGDHQVWQAKRELMIRIGNAAAVIVSVNGRSLGRLGMPGQVVVRTFTTSTP